VAEERDSTKRETLIVRGVESRAMSRSDWIAIGAALISFLAAISLLAAIFIGLMWHEARLQRQESFSSTLNFIVDASFTGKTGGIAVKNIGPGIARIRAVTFYLDGQVIQDLGDALDQAKLDPNRNEGWEIDPGDELDPSETVWLVRYKIGNREEEDRASELFGGRFQIAVDYSSRSGERKRVCTWEGPCPIQTSSDSLAPTKRRAE
jgi:hypothetical protein